MRPLLTLALILTPSLALAAEPPLIGLPFDAARATTLRTEWARAGDLPEEFTNSIDMRLVLIPGGRFDLGPNGSWHRVTIRKPFYLGTTEVTLGQYRRFKAGHAVPDAAKEFNDDDRPAAFVSWNDARAFCDWLSSQPDEKKAGRVYGLPTEAQWEWAARAGTKTSRYFGDDDKGQSDHTWFNVTYTPNPKHEVDGRGRQPVGKLKANPWGLHDLYGNVWEWIADRPANEETGEQREPTMRGGGWRSGAFHCTSVAHDPGDANLKADHVGFRVACRISR